MPEILITGHPYEIYYEMIKFVYRDIIYSPCIEIYHALIRLAHEMDYTHFLRKCENRLMESAAYEAIFDIYELGKELQLERLLSFCREVYITNPLGIQRRQIYVGIDAQQMGEFILDMVKS